MSNRQEAHIILSYPDYADRPARPETYPDEVTAYYEKGDHALEETWGTVFTQFEIAKFLGSEDVYLEGLHPRQLGHFKNESKGTREIYVSDFSRHLIAFAEDLCEKPSPQPEEIMSAMSKWVNTKLAHAYTSDQKLNRKDMSEKYRFDGLIEHIHIVYDHLLASNQGSEREALDLAVKIAIRAVGRRGYSWLYYFGTTLYAFNVWNFDPKDYPGVFREPQLKIFQKKVSSIEDTIRLHECWTRISDELRSFLSSNYVHGTEVSYEELFRRRNGFIESGFRETFSEIANEFQISPNGLKMRYPRILQAVLKNDISILLEANSELAPTKSSRPLSSEAHFINRILRVESQLGRERRNLERGDLTLVEQLEQDLIIRSLELARDSLIEQQKLGTNELDIDSIQTGLVALLSSVEFERDPFYSTLTSKIPFTKKYLGTITVDTYIRSILSDDNTIAISQIRVGLEIRDRFIAGHLLDRFDHVALQIQSFLSTLRQASSYSEVAKIYNFSPSGISSFLDYIIIEGLLRSHLDSSLQSRLAKTLNATRGTVQEVAEPRDTFDSRQIEKAISIAFLGTGKIGLRKRGGSKARRQALSVAEHLFAEEGEYPLMKSILMGTYNGASCRDIGRLVSTHPDISLNLFPVLTEAKRHITERPRSKHVKTSDTRM